MEQMNLAFTGETFQATCECHNGKTIVIVFGLDPDDGQKHPIYQGFMDREPTEEEMKKIVYDESKKFLAKHGIIVEATTEVTVKVGEEAIKAEGRYTIENNPNYH